MLTLSALQVEFNTAENRSIVSELMLKTSYDEMLSELVKVILKNYETTFSIVMNQFFSDKKVLHSCTSRGEFSNLVNFVYGIASSEINIEMDRKLLELIELTGLANLLYPNI